MRPFQSHSMFGRQVSPREQRTILIGAAVSLFALTLAYGVIPLARRWQAREEVIATKTEQLARLRGLVSGETQLREAVRLRAHTLQSGQQRLLSGRTPALAASALQSQLQGFANQSRVTVSRLDVAGEPETTGGALPMIPATVSAVGDIYGLTEMLSLIQHGPQLLEIVELTVRPNPALSGELLQMTVSLRAAYIGG